MQIGEIRSSATGVMPLEGYPLRCVRGCCRVALMRPPLHRESFAPAHETSPALLSLVLFGIDPQGNPHTAEASIEQIGKQHASREERILAASLYHCRHRTTVMGDGRGAWMMEQVSGPRDLRQRDLLLSSLRLTYVRDRVSWRVQTTATSFTVRRFDERRGFCDTKQQTWAYVV